MGCRANPREDDAVSSTPPPVAFLYEDDGLVVVDKPDKTCRALGIGVPVPAEGTITVAMHPARKGKSRPASAGESGVRDAVTRFVCICMSSARPSWPIL